MLVTLWLTEGEPIGVLLLFRPDPADFIRGMNVWASVPLRVNCGSLSWSPAQLSTQCLLLEWLLLNQRVDESVEIRFSCSSLKTCAVCYRQFDEVSQASKPAFKARPVLTLVSMCHQQCCNFHVIMGQSPVTRPFVLNLLFHTRSTAILKHQLLVVMINPPDDRSLGLWPTDLVF